MSPGPWALKKPDDGISGFISDFSVSIVSLLLLLALNLFSKPKEIKD